MSQNDTTEYDIKIMRDLLLRARSVLNTCFHDTARSLSNPERSAVILRLVEDIHEALS